MTPTVRAAYLARRDRELSTPWGVSRDVAAMWAAVCCCYGVADAGELLAAVEDFVAADRGPEWRRTAQAAMARGVVAAEVERQRERGRMLGTVESAALPLGVACG